MVSLTLPERLQLNSITAKVPTPTRGRRRRHRPAATRPQVEEVALQSGRRGSNALHGRRRLPGPGTFAEAGGRGRSCHGCGAVERAVEAEEDAVGEEAAPGQGLQTRAAPARMRCAGSEGGRRRRISRTTLSVSSGAAAAPSRSRLAACSSNRRRGERGDWFRDLNSACHLE